MKNAIVIKHVEKYCECPYCSALNTDNWNQKEGAFNQKKMICSSCKKVFSLE